MVLSVVLHIVIDAGSTFLTWHQAIGPERWSNIQAGSYEALALYCKLAVGICTTILTLKDPTWQRAKEGAS